MDEFSSRDWFKSSFSGGNGYDRAEWQAFVKGVKAGEFDA